jgi:hypothetical protein
MIREWEKDGGNLSEDWKKVKLSLRNDPRFDILNFHSTSAKIYC